MPKGTTRAVRRGKPVTWSLDPDAIALLKAMVPNSNAYGLCIGELIRKEARERVERPRLLAALAAALAGSD